MAHVFETLISIYPAWKQAAYGDVYAWSGKYKQQLFKAFRERNIKTMQQINQGFSTARKEGGAFLPNPGVFVGWCKNHSAPYHRDFDDSHLLPHMRSSTERFKTGMAELKRANREGSELLKKQREQKIGEVAV